MAQTQKVVELAAKQATKAARTGRGPKKGMQGKKGKKVAGRHLRGPRTAL